jgi:hypothetical protein
MRVRFFGYERIHAMYKMVRKFFQEASYLVQKCSVDFWSKLFVNILRIAGGTDRVNCPTQVISFKMIGYLIADCSRLLEKKEVTYVCFFAISAPNTI